MLTADPLAALGASPSGARLARIESSPNFRDGAFQNPVPTRTMLPGSLWRTLRLQLTGKQRRVPPASLPIVSPGREFFASPPRSGLRATWLGHATTLIEIDGARVLLDPVWSERASPVPWTGPRRFHPPPMRLADLPPLDAVIVSHDHYDHLDMYAVRELASSAAQATMRFVVPLGVGAHLEHWGVEPDRITELDWGEGVQAGALTLTATPARHYSGRGLSGVLGRSRSLWASWVIAGPEHRAFYSGDTGLFDGLRDVGARHGPFDLTVVKMGAYGPTWPDIHLTPEEAVRAHGMLGGRVLLPVHWGTFNLAFHAWDEPPERVLAAAREAGIELVLPRPGEAVEPDAPPPPIAWWRALGEGE